MKFIRAISTSFLVVLAGCGGSPGKSTDRSASQDQSLQEFRNEHNLGGEPGTRPGNVSIYGMLYVDGKEMGVVVLIWTEDGNLPCTYAAGCIGWRVVPGAYVQFKWGGTYHGVVFEGNAYSIAEWNQRYSSDRVMISPYEEGTTPVNSPDHYKDLSAVEQRVIEQDFCQRGLNLYDFTEYTEGPDIGVYDMSKVVSVCQSKPTAGSNDVATPQPTQAGRPIADHP